MIERFQLALQTPVGLFLLVLLGILLLLLFVYGIIMLRARRHDAYRHRNARYFEGAEAAAAEYRFVGQHHGHFFGRETQVEDKKAQRSLCLIFPPEEVTSTCCDRFSCFLHALEGGWPSHFVSYPFYECNERLLVVQQGLLSCNGKSLMPLTAYIKDKRFTLVDKEKVLMMVSHAMAQLHEAYLESGEFLYHGFLLPSTLFIDIDAAHRLSHLVIADVGFAFALGPTAMCRRIKALAEGKLMMEKYRREELLGQVPMLAPEQHDPQRLSSVGPPADFFAFGTLALLLFTGNKFQQGMTIKWERVPSRWRPFIERCLNDNPDHRPHHFNELGEWVEDPDVALTVREGDLAPTTIAALRENSVDLASLAMTLQRDPIEQTKQKKTRRKCGEELSVADCLLAGAAAMKMSRWESAKGHYETALQVEEDNAEALLKLAVCLYELGDMRAAEEYLNMAKEGDPSATRTFQQYIAFRV